MARCSNCNKFVSYGDPEVEVDDSEVNDDALSATIRVVLTCADCGDELRETSLDYDGTIEHACPFSERETRLYSVRDDDDLVPENRRLQCLSCHALFAADGDHFCKGMQQKSGWTERFAIDDVDADPASRVQTTDKHGKPIKNSRYMKTFYGAEITFNITCHRCGESFLVEGTVEEQASAFEDI